MFEQRIERFSLIPVIIYIYIYIQATGLFELRHIYLY